MIDAIANVARFEQEYQKLAEKLPTVAALQKQGIGYEQLVPLLKKDADKRMRIIRWVNVPIFEGDENG